MDQQLPANFQRLFETATAQQRQGRLSDAEKNYRAVLQAASGHVGAMHELGVLCLQSDRLDEAIGLLREAARGDSNSAAVHNNLGVALVTAKRFEEAAEVYKRCLAIDPKSVRFLVNLGGILNALGRSEEALSPLRKAITLTPNFIEAYAQLGAALMELGRHEEALVCLRKIIALDPRQPEPHNNLGLTLLQLGRSEAAMSAFEKALALKPDFVEALNNLGNTLGELERWEEAVRYFERALALEPGFADARYNLGKTLAELGRLEEARAAYEHAIVLTPKRPDIHISLSNIKRFQEGDPEIAAMEVLAQNEASLLEEERIDLHFAMAKAYDDLHWHALAFEHMKKGNVLKRASIAYDEKHELDRLAARAAVFTRDMIETRRGGGDPSELPVFILGMPRSGTSLVEQVLASHPRAFGAGELPFLSERSGTGKTEWESPERVATLSDEDLQQFGSRCVARLRSLAPQADRITDKMPGNFQHIGLIYLTLPQARIIHVRRDPRDTCLSCYSWLFESGLEFTYDLGELGRYYRAYEAMMAHWRAVLPEGAMLEVQYEALVGNFEEEARRILEHCGLEWDERCLEFHKTKRRVRTASAVQVRQPLYKSSIGRWQPYKEQLRPLLDALGMAPT